MISAVHCFGQTQKNPRAAARGQGEPDEASGSRMQFWLNRKIRLRGYAMWGGRTGSVSQMETSQPYSSDQNSLFSALVPDSK